MDYLKLAVSWIPSKKIRHYLRTCLSNVDLKQELSSIGQFLKKPIRPNSVLVAEANNTHGEVVPGYVKYLCDMGYNVDVVLTPSVAAERPFARFKDEKLRFFVLSHWMLKLFFKLPQLRHYHKIIITSSAYYFLGDGKTWPAAADVFGLQKFGQRLLVVEHDLLDVEKFSEEPLLQENRLITLSDFGRGVMVNPHYFGEIKSHSKNEMTNFIVVGGIQAQRKNHGMLIEAVKELHHSGVRNFKITIVGKGNLEGVPEEIHDYFDIKGRLDFPKMYDEMEKADFFLTLLDYTNEMHRRYLNTGTTGSRQLILGFALPCLINEKFAKFYGFNEQNAVVYPQNNLAAAMADAIKLNMDDYAKMQEKLCLLQNMVYQQSLQNFRNIAA